MLAAGGAQEAAAGFELAADQRKLIRVLTRTTRAEQSLFVYGPAGRGKSWAVNAFFDATPTRRKTRVHFHGFLDALHRSIHHRRDEQGCRRTCTPACWSMSSPGI